MGAGLRAILSALARASRETLDDRFLAETWLGILDAAGPHDALRETLARWAESDAKPLVLVLDEIDALVGRHPPRGPAPAPGRLPGAPGTVSAERDPVRGARGARLPHPFVDGECDRRWRERIQRARQIPRLGDFSAEHIESLLTQHTRETGQAFTSEDCAAIRELTRGQPWLVNALAHEACFDNRAGRDRSRAITGDSIQDAREEFFLRRDTHLDQLADMLRRSGCAGWSSRC